MGELDVKTLPAAECQEVHSVTCKSDCVKSEWKVKAVPAHAKLGLGDASHMRQVQSMMRRR